MSDTQQFLDEMMPRIHEAETALHNGDPGPRRALWSRSEPVSVLGAWRNASGRQELDELFATLGTTFSDCTSWALELLAHDVVVDLVVLAARSRGIGFA